MNLPISLFGFASDISELAQQVNRYGLVVVLAGSARATMPVEREDARPEA